MRLDSQLAFVPLSAPLSIVAGAGVAVFSNVIDLLGQGVGTAPQDIIGNAALFGSDMGVGARRPEIEAIIGTAFATSNSATLNMALQYAPDTGQAGGYLPGTFTIAGETGAMAAANLTAGKVIGRLPMLPAFPDNQRPRFMRLGFFVPAGTNFTAGTISYAGLTFCRDDLNNKNAAKNFTVA